MWSPRLARSVAPGLDFTDGFDEMTDAIAFLLRDYSRLVALVAAGLLLAGCVSSPGKPAGESGFNGIYFEENRSIDLAVRKDFDAALQLLQAGEYERAIDLLEKVKRGSQKNSAPFINIAIAQMKLGRLEKAEENLKQALAINPEHPVANNEYALLCRKTGRYAEARELYERVVKRYPEFMPLRKNYGILCELYLDDASCAMAQYQEYIQANPNDEDVKLWIASLRQRLN